MNGSTGRVQVLASTPLKACGAWWQEKLPVWSPDARYLAFPQGTNADNTASLWLWDRRTETSRLLVNNMATTFFMIAAWSHDSTRLAVAVGPSSIGMLGVGNAISPMLDVVDVTRGTVRQIGRGADAAWSPDDRLLSFVRYKGCGNTFCDGDTKVTPVAGGRAILLPNSASSEFTIHKWFPSPFGYAFDRWVLNRQGHVIRQIAGLGRASERVHWAPDGRYAVVESYGSSGQGASAFGFSLSIVSAAGVRTQVYPSAESTIHVGYEIAWQSNSAGFAFRPPSMRDDARTYIYAVHTATGQGALAPLNMPMGDLLSFTADNRDLIVSSSHGSYPNYSDTIYRYNIQSNTSTVIATEVDPPNSGSTFALQPAGRNG